MIHLQHHCDRCPSAVCILLMNVDLNKCEDIPVKEEFINTLLMGACGILSIAIQGFSSRTWELIA